MTDENVPTGWILLFLLLALGLGAAAVLFVGGSLIDSAATIAPLGAFVA
jgi:hypothetical protein